LDPLVDFAEPIVRAIENKAVDETEERRSGDYETLILRRGRRAMIDDQAIAKDIVEKVREGV
jgi:hypothetical protein